REQKDLLSQFTRDLIQSVNKTAYYTAGHAAHHEAGEPLYKMLRQFLTDSPQVGYMLNRTTPPEIFVDGLASGRVRMSDIMPAGVYSIFVPKFVQYFDRHNIVALSFRADVTLDEFVMLVTILAKPVTPGTEFDISKELTERKVLNISVLLSSEVAGADTDLPWQVRVCLARLRRDLRMLPMFKNLSHAAIVKAKRDIFQDIIRPVTNAELLRQIIVHATRIQEDISHVEGLEDLTLTPLVISALAPKPIIDLTKLLCEETAKPKAEGSKDEGRTVKEAIVMCANRLASEHITGAEPALRALYEHKFLKLEDMPQDLQDSMVAESVLHQLGDAAGAKAPLNTPQDYRVLGKLGKMAFSSDRIAVAADIAERLATAAASGRGDARSALNKLVSPKEIEGIVERYAFEKDENLARMIVAFGDVGAMALACNLAMSGANAKMDRVYHLLDKVNSPFAISSALRVPELQAPALRLLLTLAGKHPDPSLAETAAPMLTHADPQVRLAAMVAALAADSPDAVNFLTRALDDADAAVVTTALAALTKRVQRAGVAREKARALVEKPETSVAIKVAAIDLLRVSPGDAKEKEAAIALLKHVLEGDKSKRGFMGLGGKAVTDPALAKAAQAALTALGVKEEAPKKEGFFDRFRKH
ncbi:MAG: hypothetical protein ACHREM_09880, partial [Polyangiales bacterium]